MITRGCSWRWKGKGLLGNTRDFQTLTSLFSNCGSRPVWVIVCATANPAVKATAAKIKKDPALFIVLLPKSDSRHVRRIASTRIINHAVKAQRGRGEEPTPATVECSYPSALPHALLDGVPGSNGRPLPELLHHGCGLALARRIQLRPSQVEYGLTDNPLPLM